MYQRGGRRSFKCDIDGLGLSTELQGRGCVRLYGPGAVLQIVFFKLSCRAARPDPHWRMYFYVM